MGFLIDQNVGNVLDHYADVIEGGSAYSGTDRNGIPGLYSHHRYGGQSVTVDSSASVKFVTLDSGESLDADILVRSEGAPFFLRSSGSNEPLNNGISRKIAAYNDTTKVMQIAAFPAIPSASDGFTLYEGFKRAPDTIDIEADSGVAGTMDRFFRLDVEDEGEDIGIYGKNSATYRARLRLRVRFTKDGRDRNIRKKAWTNMVILRRGMLQSGQGDSTYVRALLPTGSTRISEDSQKLVASLDFDLIYRLDTSMD